MAVRQPGSASQNQRCAHPKSFCSSAVQCGITWRWGWDSQRAQQGGDRVLQPSHSEHWEGNGTYCLFVGGKLLERTTCPGPGETNGNMEPRPLLIAQY